MEASSQSVFIILHWDLLETIIYFYPLNAKLMRVSDVKEPDHEGHKATAYSR